MMDYRQFKGYIAAREDSVQSQHTLDRGRPEKTTCLSEVGVFLSLSWALLGTFYFNWSGSRPAVSYRLATAFSQFRFSPIVACTVVSELELQTAATNWRSGSMS